MCCFLLVINLIIIAKCLVRFMKLYTLQGGLIVEEVLSGGYCKYTVNNIHAHINNIDFSLSLR